MSQSENRRSFRNFLINPRYQLRFIFWAVFSCIVMIFYFTTILYTSLREYHEAVISAVSPDLQAQVNSDYLQIVSRLALGSVLILLAAVLVGLYLSHRTAGPLFQLKRAFEKIRSGAYETRVRFRPNDELQDLAESFNSMMDQIEPLASQSRKQLP